MNTGATFITSACTMLKVIENQNRQIHTNLAVLYIFLAHFPLFSLPFLFLLSIFLLSARSPLPLGGAGGGCFPLGGAGGGCFPSEGPGVGRRDSAITHTSAFRPGGSSHRNRSSECSGRPAPCRYGKPSDGGRRAMSVHATPRHIA